MSEKRAAAERPWEKVLYLKQAYADNYTDERFLESLRTNLYVRKYEYWMLVQDTGPIVQHASCVCLLPALCYDYVDATPFAASLLGLLALLLAGYLLYWGTLRVQPEHFKQLALFMLVGFIVCPILMSLTVSISSDTIATMVGLSLLLCLLAHNYTLEPPVLRPVSFNCALAATIFLSSRFDSVSKAYLVVNVGVVLFGLWPLLRVRLARRGYRLQNALTLLHLAVVLLALLAARRFALAAVFTLVALFLAFACPAILLNLQRYKNNIYGPWDEAVIIE